jgi:hypothetical protein
MLVSAVVFREDLYPRIETNAIAVQKYADDLDVLPPIEVNQRGELIDGWHRWTAHRKVGAETIRVTVTETSSDAEVLELSIERNAKHGLQLSQQDKKDLAVRLYSATPDRERDAKKAYLAKILSVSERTVREWTSRTDKDSKAARDRRIFDMWLACYTQEEIGEAVGCSQDTVALVLRGMASLPEFVKSDQASASHAVDFDIPLYNVWKRRARWERCSTTFAVVPPGTCFGPECLRGWR